MQRDRRTGLGVGVVVLAGAALVFGLAQDAGAKRRRAPEWYQYSVAFTCGTAADAVRVAPGLYALTVSLHNPHLVDATVRKSLALSFPPGGQTSGEVSNVAESILDDGDAVAVDCDDVLNGGFVFTTPPPASTYVQGVLVIESSLPLNVTSTQSGTGATGEVSVDVEVVRERAVAPLDLGGKEAVCHAPPGNPSNAHTIYVGSSAVPAHLAHGDALGACPGDDGDSDSDSD